jgi:hypothetical protein
LDNILAHQSSEGWFLEYDGADPGYQTLCIDYLARVYQLKPNVELRAAIEKALYFLSWFVHPDGTFGGEYGSRRTAIYYPGGLALLSGEFPIASSITHFMLKSISQNQTVTLSNIDMGNLAPLLSSYVLTLEAQIPNEERDVPLLPWEKSDVSQNYAGAGLFVRGTKRYYAIAGASNGGVLKVFDREKQTITWNDGGYIGQTKKGVYLTTQITDLSRLCLATPKEIEIHSTFYEISQSMPTPLRFVILRLLNLSLMRNLKIGNRIKKLLVILLISGKRSAPFSLTRKLRFEPYKVTISDALKAKSRLALRWLEFGRPFVAIHMASARYFENFLSAQKGLSPRSVAFEKLQKECTIETEVTI